MLGWADLVRDWLLMCFGVGAVQVEIVRVFRFRSISEPGSSYVTDEEI